MCITMLFTFIPILLVASLPWTHDINGSFGDDFWNSFASYWENGEMVLPILGLCGFITVTLFRYGISRTWEKIILLTVTVIALLSGLFVSESDGFELPLATLIIYSGYFIYLFLAVVCIGLIAVIEPPKSIRMNSSEPGYKLLKDADAIRDKKKL